MLSKSKLAPTLESGLGNKHMSFLGLIFLEEFLLVSSRGIQDYATSFVLKSLQPARAVPLALVLS